MKIEHNNSVNLPYKFHGIITMNNIQTARKNNIGDDFPLLPEGYRPDKGEVFMNPLQREYFRHKLLCWRASLLRESEETLYALQRESFAYPDISDRAATEGNRSRELRTRDRFRKLIAKIDCALERIADGTYGYCELTGEPISLSRLEVRPIATMTVEAQELHERREKIFASD